MNDQPNEKVQRDVYRYSSDTNGIMYPRKDGLWVEWGAYTAMKARAEAAEQRVRVLEESSGRMLAALVISAGGEVRIDNATLRRVDWTIERTDGHDGVIFRARPTA